jgi:glycerophosphoryl diester phosphodiesterase
MLRIGHRGAAGSAPENTIASVKRALSIGVDAIEFDVHRTHDNHLVVIHDPTLEEIRQYDAGSYFGPAFGGERVPTLLELVEAIPAPTQLFLELKFGSFMYPGIERDLAQFVKYHDIGNRVLISSFDHHALRLLRELLPDVPTGLLYYARPLDPIGMARACGATALHPMWLYLSPEDIAEAHAAGLRVNVWTPNFEADVAQCLALQVDGIITDRPELLPPE